MDSMKTQTPAIVLIEEDKVTLELYRRELSKSFTVFPFEEVNNVSETIAAHQDIQAVVIEPETCSGRGWELVNTLCTTFPDRSIAIIVCSTRDTCNHFPLQGVSNYLTKPVLPKMLREITIDAIENREGHQNK
jgi:response regulator RpfG family c-di-GMP phosphodiesterase